MRLPDVSAPVSRNRVSGSMATPGLLPQGCSVGQWFECAGLVTLCAAACVLTEGEACIECLGPSYDTCVSCF